MSILRSTNKGKTGAGFTLIELIVTMALLAVLSAVVFTVYNPAGQLAGSRNKERTLHLQTIMQGVRQNIADQSNQQFACSSGPIPTSTTRMSSLPPGYNIAPCLVPTYLFTLPFDPSTSSAHYTSNSDYDTGYNISINSSTGQITLSAPATEMATSAISVTR